MSGRFSHSYNPSTKSSYSLSCLGGFKNGMPFKDWEFNDKMLVSLFSHKRNKGRFGQQKEKATVGYLRSLKSLEPK